MRTRAAVLWQVGTPWSIEDVELDAPQAHEVLVRVEAAGMCHSDDHMRTGDGAALLPTIGGHEGAGVIEEIGPGVEGLEVGDHIVFSFTPACGRCRWCAIGRSNLCDYGQFLMQGGMISGGYRAHVDGKDVGTLSLIGSFAERTVVHETSIVKIDKDIPFEIACLLGCGVPTGWGSAVNIGQVQPGETAVVVGIGGIGANAIQGARLAGAQHIVAVDPVPFKLDQAKTFGATHTAPSMEAAMEVVRDITYGAMADVGVCTIGIVEGWMIQPFLDLVSKGGRAVLTGMARSTDESPRLGMQLFSLFEKSLLGTIYGGCNPRSDIPRLASLYKAGKLQLNELVTRTYTLDQINEGYDDMLAGRNIRGVIVNSF